MERFDGVPVWHASVAKHREWGRPLVPTEDWTRKDVARARELLALALDGVGMPGHQVEERLGRSLQIRRLATEDERRVIGPAKDMRAAQASKEPR